MAPSTARYHFILNDSMRIKNPSMRRKIQLTGSGKPSVSTRPSLLIMELLS